MESWWSSTSVFPGEDLQVSPEPLCTPFRTHETTVYGTTFRFQEEDAADGTSFAPFDLCKSTRQFLSSETQHSTINASTESAPTRPKKKKTLPQDYRHRLCASSPSNRRQARAKRR